MLPCIQPRLGKVGGPVRYLGPKLPTHPLVAPSLLNGQRARNLVTVREVS